MTAPTTPKRPFDEERKFIHDLATPVTTIHLLVETGIESLNRIGAANPEIAEKLKAEAERLRKVLDAAQKLSNKLHERRNVLIAASENLPE